MYLETEAYNGHQADLSLDRAYTRGGIEMTEIRVGENESIDSAIKRFKRQCARSGVLGEVRKREHYEKPSVRRKLKSEAARRKKTSKVLT